MENKGLAAKLYDKDFRAQLVANPKQTLSDLTAGAVDSDKEYVVVKNTKDVTYFILEDSETNIDLSNVQAAGYASTASTSATLGTVCTTASSLGSVATAGSAI